MAKYINAEKLKELIDERWKELADKNVKVGGGKWDAEISTYLSVLNLINSLQEELPHWKPSEEQMEALRLSFEDAFDDAGDCYRYRELKSLYKQLKKLM